MALSNFSVMPFERCQVNFSFKRWFSGDKILPKLGRNLLKTLHDPKNVLSSIRPFDGLRLQIASDMCDESSRGL